jgi:hypothetical protein
VEALDLPLQVPVLPATPPATRTVFRPGIAMILVALLVAPVLYFVWAAGNP